MFLFQCGVTDAQNRQTAAEVRRRHSVIVGVEALFLRTGYRYSTFPVRFAVFSAKAIDRQVCRVWQFFWVETTGETQKSYLSSRKAGGGSWQTYALQRHRACAIDSARSSAIPSQSARASADSPTHRASARSQHLDTKQPSLWSGKSRSWSVGRGSADSGTCDKLSRRGESPAPPYNPSAS